MPRGAVSGHAVLGMDDLDKLLVDMGLGSGLVFSLEGMAWASGGYLFV